MDMFCTFSAIVRYSPRIKHLYKYYGLFVKYYNQVRGSHIPTLRPSTHIQNIPNEVLPVDKITTGFPLWHQCTHYVSILYSPPLQIILPLLKYETGSISYVILKKFHPFIQPLLEIIYWDDSYISLVK